MTNISLRGSEIQYSKSSTETYLVLRGTVLTYIIPVEDGTQGKRLLLGEYTEGDRFPGFFYSSELLGTWYLGIMALDKAEMGLLDDKADESLYLETAKRVGMTLYNADDYEPMLIELYERNRMKENGYIYATKRNREWRKENTLRLIDSVFAKDGLGQEQAAIEPTGKLRYDAIAFICKKNNIPLAPLARITESGGLNPSVIDIARVSHFIIRDIVLEPGWYRQDNGAILAFWKESKTPVACVPKGPSRYILYDPQYGSIVRVTDKIAETITPKAYTLYRPFPDSPVTTKDLILFGFKAAYRSDFVRLFALTLFITLLGLLIPYMNEQAYDKFIPMGYESGLVQIGIVMLSCMMGNVAFTIVRNLASFRSMNAMRYAVQAATFDRLFNLSEGFLVRYDSAVIGQYALGIGTIYNTVADSLITTLLGFVFSVIYMIRMFRYSGTMAKWALGLLAVISLIIILFGIIQTKYEHEKRAVDIEVSSRAFQFMFGIEKIRNAWAEDLALDRYFHKYVESVRLNTKKERLVIAVSTMMGAFSILTSIVFYYLMIKMNIGLSIGAFSGFTAAYGAFSRAVTSLVQSFLTVNVIKPMYDDAKIILMEPPELLNDTRMPGNIEGNIEMSNVTFSYSKDTLPVLQNLNLKIKAGEYLGIVGPSGCGKSTLLKLLLGFEKPTIGKIYIDNNDIDEIDKRELRKKFGVVLQDGGLINGSIYDNITITSPGAKKSQVEQVIRSVGLEADVQQMPMGIHTMLTDGSGSLSGGQRQRVLIARAIIGAPKVIFLDEATSALDNVTQHQVVTTLEKLDATKIVIAHRLSTVKNCDRIIVLDRGRIAEEGTYGELMEKKGLFYQQALRQITKAEA